MRNVLRTGKRLLRLAAEGFVPASLAASLCSVPLSTILLAVERGDLEGRLAGGFQHVRWGCVLRWSGPDSALLPRTARDALSASSHPGLASPRGSPYG